MEEMVCQICGVSGFIEHLVLCSTCNISAEHRYCMGNGHYMQESEPNWLCVGCRTKSSKLASFKRSIPLRHTQLIDFLPNTQRRSRKKKTNPIIAEALKSCRSNELTFPGKKSSLAVNSTAKVNEVNTHLPAMRIGSLSHLPTKKLDGTKRKLMESAQQEQQQKDSKLDKYALPCRKNFVVEKLEGNIRLTLPSQDKLEETNKVGLVNQKSGKGQNTQAKKSLGKMPLLNDVNHSLGKMPLLNDVNHFESGNLSRCITDATGSRQFRVGLSTETHDIELNRHIKSSDGVDFKDHKTLRSPDKGLPNKKLQVNLTGPDVKMEKLHPNEHLSSEASNLTLEVQTDSFVGSPKTEGMLLVQTCKSQLNMHSQSRLDENLKRYRSLVLPKEEQLNEEIPVNSSSKDACNQTFHSGGHLLNVSSCHLPEQTDALTGCQKSEAIIEVGSCNAESCIHRKLSEGKYLKNRRRLVLADEDKLEDILDNLIDEDDRIRIPQSKEPLLLLPDWDPKDVHGSEAMLLAGECNLQLNLPSKHSNGEDLLKGKRLVLNEKQFDRESQLNLIDKNTIVESFGAIEDMVLQADRVSTVQANTPTTGCESQSVAYVKTCNAHLFLLSKLPDKEQVEKKLKLDFNGEDTGAVHDPDCAPMRQSNILLASNSHTLATEDPYKNCSPPGRPIFDCSWRGCFDASNIKYGPLVAHLSSKACDKVICIAKNMPTVLQMTMLPRLQIWPKSFERSPPSDYNIGLYFFSVDYRMKKFCHLLDEVIKMDLGLKVVLDDAELLIFSSNVLSESYQRFRQDYYFWGMFRERQDEVYATLTSFCPKLKSHPAFSMNEKLEEKVNDYDGKCKEEMSFPISKNEDGNLSPSLSLTERITVCKEKNAYHACDDLVDEAGNNFRRSGMQLGYDRMAVPKVIKDYSVDLVHRGEEEVGQACLPSRGPNARGKGVKFDIRKQGPYKGFAVEGQKKFKRQRKFAPRPFNPAYHPDDSSNLDPRRQEQIAAKEKLVVKDSELDLPRGESRNLDIRVLQEGCSGKRKNNFKRKINFASRPYRVQEQIAVKDCEHDLPQGEARKLDIKKRALQVGYAGKGQKKFKRKVKFAPRPFNGSCHICGKNGHRAVDCIQSTIPGPNHKGKVGMTFTGLCYSCHKSGHIAAQCPFMHNQYKGDAAKEISVTNHNQKDGQLTNVQRSKAMVIIRNVILDLEHNHFKGDAVKEVSMTNQKDEQLTFVQRAKDMEITGDVLVDLDGTGAVDTLNVDAEDSVDEVRNHHHQEQVFVTSPNDERFINDEQMSEDMDISEDYWQDTMIMFGMR